MSLDKRSRQRQTPPRRPAPKVKTGPSSDDAHDVVYFRRHRDDGADETAPGRDFLNGCPAKVRATMCSVLVAVAEAPPKRYAGGGYWGAMKGDMTGLVRGASRRPEAPPLPPVLPPRLRGEERWVDKPLLVVIAGLDKPFRTELSAADYAGVRSLGEEYLSHNPRSIC